MMGTLLFIVAYGVWKTRNVSSVRSYLLGDRDLPWYTIGLSVMATQASAITFLSTPGQAYDDGMRFVQFYFGLPIAMVILCIFILPIYYRLKVYTAYEYLERRFDIKTRALTAFFFLISRGLSAGITIYAPAIILSDIMAWDLNYTILAIGVIVIFYTMMGGTKAVSVTQKQQMIVILSGMFIAAVIIVLKLPADVSFGKAVAVAGKMGKLNVVDLEFDLQNRYNIWSGLLGGVFLFLSYFGTDQSQVQRYLSGKSLAQSRLGLLFNGIIKVPMQFLVLFTGILVFVFFQFTQPPVHYNEANLLKVVRSEQRPQLEVLQKEFEQVFIQKKAAIRQLIAAIDQEDETLINTHKARVQALVAREKAIRSQVDELVQRVDPHADVEDNDYIFITFVTQYLPIGLVGLLLAVIFSAAMSSISSELNALATTTVIDFYRRLLRKHESDRHYFNASKLFTVVWGLVAVSFAAFASLFENLIEAVNIVGSLFYGVILGVFLTAFFLKRITATPAFIGALLAEVCVVTVFLLDHHGYIRLGYLWLNMIGCVLTMLFSTLLQPLWQKEQAAVG